jgi:hypothetical protein
VPQCWSYIVFWLKTRWCDSSKLCSSGITRIKNERENLFCWNTDELHSNLRNNKYLSCFKTKFQ